MDDFQHLPASRLHGEEWELPGLFHVPHRIRALSRALAWLKKNPVPSIENHPDPHLLVQLLHEPRGARCARCARCAHCAAPQDPNWATVRLPPTPHMALVPRAEPLRLTRNLQDAPGGRNGTPQTGEFLGTSFLCGVCHGVDVT